MDNDAHGFIEDVFEAFLREGTAFHILALELLLDYLTGCLSHYRGLFRVLLVDRVLLPQVDLVTHEDLGHVAHVLLQLRIPLNITIATLLRALTKDEGSTTEKTMRKTSQLG